MGKPGSITSKTVIMFIIHDHLLNLCPFRITVSLYQTLAKKMQTMMGLETPVMKTQMEMGSLTLR